MYCFCWHKHVRLLLMAWRYFGGGILEGLLRGTNCWKREFNALREYPFAVDLFGFGNMVS